MKAGNAFIYHLSEGTDPKLIDEYTKMRQEDCLLPTFNAIHCTALHKAEDQQWSPKSNVIWSPFSNLWLYRDTTDVVAARDERLRVCLGSDWSPSGSKNLLGELKVADFWNRGPLDRAFSDKELCEMVTCNPADALNWEERIGRLQQGLHGDVVVTTDRGPDPYRNLVTRSSATCCSWRSTATPSTARTS